MRKVRVASWNPDKAALSQWTGPLLGLAVCLFCFGILLARLGFFQDDWHHVFYAYWQGVPGLQRFLLTDRGPFAWIVYAFFFKLLGFSPAAWHWALMFIRYLTGLVFWFGLRRIWPVQGTLTSWLTLLFLVYPIFSLQPLSVAYTLHWTMYLVFMLSLLLMLEALRFPKARLVLTVLAVVLEATHLVFIEYFSGLELTRPIFLWLVLRVYSGRERAKQAAIHSTPYFIVLLLYVAYRSSYGAIFGYDRFTPLATLQSLVGAPLSGLQSIFQSALQDIVYILLSQWSAALDPAIIDLTRPSTYIIFGSMLAFAAISFLGFTRSDRLNRDTGNPAMGRQVAIAGLLAVVLAMLPFWFTGFSIYQKNQLWSERLALAAMPGASMLLVGTVYMLIENNRHRNLVLSAFLGIAVGLHVQTARNFQASSDKQQQFYWQMRWRAPALQANTLVVADQEILFYMGIYPTAFAINLLYPQITEPPLASYWFNAGFEHMNFDRFAAGEPDSFEKYGTTFTATVRDVLAITFEPGQEQCLWILRPELAQARGLTEAASTWLEVSKPSRIEAHTKGVPPPPIFGREPKHTWCYYYESADLAAQFHRWESVAELWHMAGAQGVRAPNSIEMLPFISAFARLSDWEKAWALTRQAQVLPDRSIATLCDLWTNLAADTPASPLRDQTLSQVQAELGCQW